MLTCLYWVCFAFIVIWMVSPKRSWQGRAFAAAVLAGSFVLDYYTGWGWILVLLFGGVCWSAARAGET